MPLLDQLGITVDDVPAAIRQFDPALSALGFTRVDADNGSSLQQDDEVELIDTTSGAIVSVARSLAVELAPLRVNVVAPGVVRSPLWDGLSAGPAKACTRAFRPLCRSAASPSPTTSRRPSCP